MNDVFLELKEKFNVIKQKGFVKGVSNNFSGVGKTLEYLLGIESNYKPVSDYKGIEIKTKCFNSKYDITLFSIMPSSENIKLLPEHLVKIYGYYLNDTTRKVLYTHCYATKIHYGLGAFGFFIFIDKGSEKIYLLVFDKKMRIVRKDIFWTFEQIKKILEKKMKYLAYFKTNATYIRGNYYYLYEKMDFYQLKSFENFLSLIEHGDIYVGFDIAEHKKYGDEMKLDYHGVRFFISEKKLLKMYNKIYF